MKVAVEAQNDMTLEGMLQAVGLGHSSDPPIER